MGKGKAKGFKDAPKEDLVEKNPTPINCKTCTRELLNGKQLCRGWKEFITSDGGEQAQKKFQVYMIASFRKGPECFGLEDMDNNFHIDLFCADRKNFCACSSTEDCGG